MTAFGNLLQQPWVERLGWTLVHFLWQGVLVACLAGVAFWLLRHRSAQARYLVGCSALLAMLAGPLATFWLVPVSPPTVAGKAVEPVPGPGEAQMPASNDRPNLQQSSRRIEPPPREEVRPQGVAEPPQAAASPGMAARLRPLLPWLVTAWLVGVLALLARHVGGWIRIQRLRHRQTTPVPAPILETLRQLIARLRVLRPVKMLQSALVEVPTVIGWLRPVILLPVSALTGLGPDQLEALLAHELAHIRRHDYLVNLLQTLVETLLFYHPAVWWLSQHIRQERENCCDDLAAAVCGNRIAYARALLAMEELRAEDAQLVVAARGGSLFARIRRLVGLPEAKGRPRVRSLAAVMAILAILTALVGWQIAQGNDTAAVSWKAGGQPLVVTARVEDLEGRPLSGIYVEAESPSGTVGATTDANGIASIFLGQPDLIGIYVGRVKVAEWSFHWGVDCSEGLDVTITVKSQSCLTDSGNAATTLPPSQRDRREFITKLAQVRNDSTHDEVRRLLGAPDDVRQAPDRTPYPTDEIWCYGTAGHGSLATLGRVCFREGRVIWTAGGHGEPPSPSVISEEELLAGMRFLHPGPEYAGYNDPLHLIRVTNYLQPLGKEKALAIIGEYARVGGPEFDETWLFLLLRTLFEVPQPPGHMPEMLIGALSPAPPDNRARIPRFPIVILDDIPFSLLWGVTLGGQPEPVSQHVEYFRKHGTLRAGTLRPPDDPYPSYRKLLASKEWAEVATSEDGEGPSLDYSGHTFLQVLALGRTAYDPPEARQPFAYPKTSEYDRHHKAFLATGARWDEKLQMYVRRDGTHGPVGHLANIYASDTEHGPGAPQPAEKPTVTNGPMLGWQIVASVGGNDAITQIHVASLLKSHGIDSLIEGSVVYGVSVPAKDVQRSIEILKKDVVARKYFVVFHDGKQDQTYSVREIRWTSDRPGKKYEDLLRLPQYGEATDLGAVLRHAEVTKAAATFPFVAEVESLRREYLDPRGRLKTGHDVRLVLTTDTAGANGGASLFFQVWDDGKEVRQTGASQSKAQPKSPTVPVNNANMKELTALTDAVNKDDAAVLKKVLGAGANPNIVMLSGETVLHGAAGMGRRKCVQVLLEHDADVRVADNQGRTPLHYAANHAQPEIVEDLLKAGADPTAKDRAGKTALDLARNVRAAAAATSTRGKKAQRCVEILQAADLIVLLTNEDVRWDGTPFGLWPWIEGKPAQQLLALGKQASPELRKALSEPKKFAAAHVLLTQIDGPKELPLSASHWNNLKVTLHANGKIDLHPEQIERIKAMWTIDAKTEPAGRSEKEVAATQPSEMIEVFRYHPAIIPDMEARNHDTEIVLARLKKLPLTGIEVQGGLGHDGYTVSIPRGDREKWRAACKDLLDGKTLRHFKKFGLDDQGLGFLPIEQAAAGKREDGPASTPAWGDETALQARFIGEVKWIEKAGNRQATVVPVGVVDMNWLVGIEVRSVEKAARLFDKPGPLVLAIHSPARTFGEDRAKVPGKTYSFTVTGKLREGKPAYHFLAARPQWSWDDKLGQTIEVSGTAYDSQKGPDESYVETEHGMVYLDGLTRWPKDLEGKQVVVTGILIKKHDLPVSIWKEGEPAQQGIPVPPGTNLHEAAKRFLLKDAKWKVAAETREAADRAALVARIHQLAKEGPLDELKAILDRHPDLTDAIQQFPEPPPHKPLRTDGFTPLETALWFRQGQIAADLIRRGANVNPAEGDSWTPLHIAALQGDVAAVKLLVERGAKVDAKTKPVPESFGIPPSSPPGAKPLHNPGIPARTPLDVAIHAKHADVAEHLKSGAARQGTTTKELTIDVDAAGRVMIEGRPYDAGALENRLRQSLKDNPDLRVVVRCNRDALWEHPVKVLNSAKAAGVKNIGVTAAVSKPEEQKPDAGSNAPGNIDPVAELNRQIEKFNSDRFWANRGVVPINEQVFRIEYDAKQGVATCFDMLENAFLTLTRQPDGRFHGTIKVPWGRQPEPGEGNRLVHGDMTVDFFLPKGTRFPPIPLPAPGPDGLVASRGLGKAFAELLAETVAKTRITGGKVPEDWLQPTFLRRVVQQFENNDPKLLRVTPETERQFREGKFDEADATRRVRESSEVLKNLGVEIPLPLPYVLDQFDAGKLQGARLELAARLLAAEVAGIKKKLGDAQPLPTPPDGSKPGVASSKLEQFVSKGKVGFFDSNGQTVIDPIYDDAQDFSHGLAAVNLGAERDAHVPAKRGGKWGYIDAKGHVVVPITLQWAAPFSDGLAKVGDEKGTRFIDTRGKTVLTLKDMHSCGNFSDGLCPVREDVSLKGGYFKTRYIDHAGKTLFTVDGYGEDFHEGLAAFAVDDRAKKDARLSGFINRKGEIAIKPAYAEAQAFSGGLAAVRPEKIGPYYGRGDRWGYIDPSGKYAIPPRFNEARPFVNGIAAVHEGGKLVERTVHSPPDWEGGRWMMIDKTGGDAAAPFRADAEKAKAALLRLIHGDRKLFVGDPNPDRLEKMPLKFYDLQEPHKFSWGAFVIDVKARTYRADLEVENGAWFYSGKFEVDAAGQWTAGKPEVAHASGPARPG